MTRQKKRSSKTSIRRQKTRQKSVSSRKKSSKVVALPIWAGSLLTAILSFLLVLKVTPFIPSFSGSSSILLGLSLSTALIVFFTMHFQSKVWARFLVLFLVALFFGVNFISSMGLKFEWLSGPIWKNLSTYTIAPGAVFIWVSILKYSGSAISDDSLSKERSEKVSIQKNPIYFSIALVVLLISALMIFYKLGYYNLGVDEPLLFNAARGFNTHGFAYFETGYNRAWVNSVFIGFSMRLFGETEWAARIPAAVMGLVFVFTSFYVFTKGWKNRYLALLIPLLCLMNDRFLYQFRIVRMYAFLIPLFLISMYLLYRLLTSEKGIKLKKDTFQKVALLYNEWVKLDIKYVIAFAIMIPLLVHFHKLSLIILPIVLISVLALTLLTREKKYISASIIVLFTGSLAYILIYVAKIRSLGFIRTGVDRMIKEALTINTYYEYMFDNGMPVSTTILLLLGSGAILFAKTSKKVKVFHLISFVGVILSFILMAYMIYNENGGRDYRYIAHFTPFTVGIGLFTLAFLGSRVFQLKRYYPLLWLLPLTYSAIHFNEDKDRTYEIHSWHPQYELAYRTITDQYKPGESIFGMNISKYYFDAKGLAGEKYVNIPRNKSYTLTQLKRDMQKAGSGWITWPIIKMNHLNKDVMNYIYKNCKHLHGYRIDNTAIEVFYFNNT